MPSSHDARDASRLSLWETATAILFFAMGTITALKPHAKRAARVNVYVDGQLVLGVSALLAARLRVGQTLSDEDVANLAREEALETAREIALRFLAPRPRSVAEVRQHLAKKKFAAEVIDHVLARLHEVGLVDDTGFARYWVENREQFQPRAARALRVELKRKGLDENDIAAALANVDERESAYRAAQARAYRWRHSERREFLEKMIAFLMRRGFDYPTAKEAAQRTWDTHHPQEHSSG